MVELIKCVTREKVKNVLFKMKSLKAPGPDGFNVFFYKKAWPIVGEDFMDAVIYFFENGRILREWNDTALTLIPKVANPSRMSDFRPIACCNVMYKCISKIMANRLKGVLPTLINEAQLAFVPGRSIGDSILIAQELVRNYHQSNTKSRCTIKVDILKAYDMVN